MKNTNVHSAEYEEFIHSLNTGLNGAEKVEDFEGSYRLSYLAQQYAKRSGRRRAVVPEHVFSAQFVLQQAAQRHFSLLAMAVSSISGLFCEREMSVLLNSGCCPVWRYQAGASLAGNVADDLGVEELDELKDGTELKILLQKLIDLTSLQTAALVDLCERFWRSPSNSSLGETFRTMGLELVE